MKKYLKPLFALLISLALYSCFEDRNGKFMYKVVNLEAFNSESDDYNSNLPSNKYGEGFLTFSTKRELKEKFNLVSFFTQISYDEK